MTIDTTQGNADQPIMNDPVVDKLLTDMMRKSYLDYAMSVITSRALPDVRDGFKPVHRRILHAMNEAGNTHNKPYKKSARMVGDVLGKYHPHGDTAVYDAATRMARDFAMNHVLIDGQGNLGSIDGDNPAAMRYTEMRLTRLTSEFFKDLHKETIAWRDNYDGTEIEPSVITVPFPQLLVNGTDGIAVGMATSVPPHNLQEVIDATLMLMENPSASTADISSVLRGPDFPTNGLLYGLDGFYDAFDTGTGRVNLRAKWHEEERGRGASSIIIDEIPYQVTKSDLVAKIAELAVSKEVADIVNIQDESNKDGIRINIQLKRDASAEAIFAELCAKSNLETTISYNATVLHEGKPRVTPLREIITSWIAFRQETVLKRFIFDRKKAQERLHILEGYMRALGMLDEVIALIRGASNSEEARKGIIELLHIDEPQAQAILDLKLQRLTGMELDSIRSEHAEFVALVAELTAVIESPQRIDQVIREELADIRQRYGIPRRTEIGIGITSVTREDMIPREDVLITMTRDGYVKRMPINALSRQNRGTRGKRTVELGESDVVNFMRQAHSHDSLLVFSKSGQAYGIKSYRVPEASVSAKGRHIRNVIEGLDEEIDAVLTLPENDDNVSVFTVTAQGTVKRTVVSAYQGTTRRGGTLGVGIDEGDYLISAAAVRENDHVILVANSGKAIRFKVSDIRCTGRTSTGVRGIRLDTDEKVVGMMVIPDGNDNDLYLLCVGERGVGKRTAACEFNTQYRGGGGVTAFRANRKTGTLITAMGVDLNQDLVMFTAKGITNRIAVQAISQSGRATSGVYLMNLDENDTLTNATPTARQVDEPAQTEDESSGSSTQTQAQDPASAPDSA